MQLYMKLTKLCYILRKVRLTSYQVVPLDFTKIYSNVFFLWPTLHSSSCQMKFKKKQIDCNTKFPQKPE